jgi:hypothetical protein
MPYFLRAIYLIVIVIMLGGLGVAQQPTPTPAPEPPPAPESTPEPRAPEPQALAPQTAPERPAAAPNSQTGNPQASPTPPPSQKESEEEIQKKEQSQRILGVAPQFSVTSRQNAPPLTPHQKFHLFVKSARDPFIFVAAGVQAGLGQATDSFSGYGQGAAGYGKRFGASLADATSSNFFSNFAYPVLLKEDPRYFRLGEGTIKHRIWYSLKQEFVTRTDKGTRRFNYSNVLGAFTSGALSNAYYPESDRGFGLTMSRSAIALGYGSLGGLIDEFWFDINERLFHKHKKKPATPATPTTPPPTPKDN